MHKRRHESPPELIHFLTGRGKEKRAKRKKVEQGRKSQEKGQRCSTVNGHCEDYAKSRVSRGGAIRMHQEGGVESSR